MHGKFMINKPIYVAHAQRKCDRKTMLSGQFMQHLAKLRMQSGQPLATGGAIAGGMYPNSGYIMAPTAAVPNRQSIYAGYPSIYMNAGNSEFDF